MSESTAAGSRPTASSRPTDGQGGDPARASRPSVCDSASASIRRLFCPVMGMQAGNTTGQLAGETQNLLRARLRAVAGLMLLGSVLFLLRDLLFDSVPFIAQQLVSLAVLVGGARLLMSSRSLSLGQLRAAELVLFGTMALHIFVVNYIATQFQAETNTLLPVSAMYRFALSYFAMMMVYGTFIPNTWRRTAVMVAPMALAPGLLTGLLYARHPGFRDALAAKVSIDDLTFVGLALFTGAVTAVVGSHMIHSIRKERLHEREMGLYELKERIGVGGMGEVWKASHRMLSRPAAIKTIRPEALGGAADETIIRRFQREAEVTSSLRSPHTVQLFDFGVTREGTFYYVMEYLDGVDLESLVKQFGPQPAERVVHILRQAASSLAEAHGMGLIHRDIKPSNLFLCTLGVEYDFLKVLDFGLVKQSRQAVPGVTLTNERNTTGTPAFMPPEVALGDRPVDARTDIYALGCVGYWLLTGKHLFDSTTPMELIVDHVKTQPLRPSDRTGLAFPSGLEDVIMRTLQKAPGDRQPDMLSLVAELDAIRTGPSWTQSQAAAWWRHNLPNEAQLSVA